jgi:hypothetical protein
MAEKPSPLAKIAVGSLIAGSGALVIYNLFFRPKPTVPVTLQSNPIRTVLLIDDKIEVATPKTVKLTKGKHKFGAIPKSPDLTLTYGFHKWTVDGETVSHNPTTSLNITRPTAITANFLVAEAGLYPIIETA